MRVLILSLTAALINGTGLAQEPDQKAVDVIYGLLWDSVDYLQSGEPAPYFIGSNQQFAGLMGREDLIPMERKVHLGELIGACGASIGPVLETALEKAADTQIVILSEAHMMPLHRAGILGIVDGLVDAGFTHYAYESFEPSITDRPEAYIRADDVFYSNDPIHARLLRQLKARGITLVAYEDDRPEDREIAQALNLKERVFDKDPDARLIVVPGWSHVYEHGKDGPSTWMAGEVKNLTGHDPLTLSQTACYATGNAPVLAQTRQENDGETKAYTITDYMIGHPPLTFTKSRPDWRRVLGDIDTPVPAAFLGLDEPVIIEARYPDEPELAVPVERLLLFPGETDIPLLLPPGTYRVEAFTKTGRVGTPVALNVASTAASTR